jgi:hypothetical protein
MRRDTHQSRPNQVQPSGHQQPSLQTPLLDEGRAPETPGQAPGCEDCRYYAIKSGVEGEARRDKGRMRGRQSGRVTGEGLNRVV